MLPLALASCAGPPNGAATGTVSTTRLVFGSIFAAAGPLASGGSLWFAIQTAQELNAMPTGLVPFVGMAASTACVVGSMRVTVPASRSTSQIDPKP